MFVSALPYLRTIKVQLANDHMFDSTREVSSSKKFLSKYQSCYCKCPLYGTVLGKLESSQKKLLKGFKERFIGMDVKIM